MKRGAVYLSRGWLRKPSCLQVRGTGLGLVAGILGEHRVGRAHTIRSSKFRQASSPVERYRGSWRLA